MAKSEKKTINYEKYIIHNTQAFLMVVQKKHGCSLYSGPQTTIVTIPSGPHPQQHTWTIKEPLIVTSEHAQDAT